MSIEQVLLDEGYEGVKFLSNYDYETALVGVTTDGRTVYDYDKMVEWLMTAEGFSEEEATEWINYNTIRALPYMGADSPIVYYPLQGGGDGS